MKKQFVSLFFLLVYIVILIKVMVFKDVPAIRIGVVTLNFGGTHEGTANLIPFKTILPYLLGQGGIIIGGLNIGGNIALLIPIGFLIPLLFQHIDKKTMMVLSVISGLSIEITQVILKVGIFDIDDVLLNAIGVIIGYWIYRIFPRLLLIIKSHKIAFIVLIAIIIALVFYGVSLLQQSFPPLQLPPGQEQHRLEQITNGKTTTDQLQDPCNGTGGTGEIISINQGNIFAIKRRDGLIQQIKVGNSTKIRNAERNLSLVDLHIGDRVTLVVETKNQDGSDNATLVLVCGGISKKPAK